MSRRSHLRRAILSCGTVLFATAIAGCVNIFWQTHVVPLSAKPDSLPAGTIIKSPLKVHLADGSIVLFRSGAEITRQHIRARRTGYGVGFAFLTDSAFVRNSVPVDSIVGVEAFSGSVQPLPTLVVSAAATAFGAMGTGLLLVAIFGSCPTVYVDSAGSDILQAEGFSYAIAPMFEHRDVDALRVRPDSAGIIRLELRNEALETHYVNHLELLAAQHPIGTRVIPDQSGQPVIIGSAQPLAAARDRAGRDVRDVLARADGDLFASSPTTVDRARIGDLGDWIDIEAGGLAPGDSIAVVLRLRNSLLNTVLLYEGMLGGHDALDWMNTRLEHIASVVDLARWYTRTMGMRATVRDPNPTLGATTGHSVRLGDVGPLAFRDVAIVLPRPERGGGRVRVRLEFVADNWRIDHAAISGSVSPAAVTTIAATRVVVPTPADGGPPRTDTLALPAIAEADDRYLETRPGQRMTIEFAGTRRSAPNSTTSYLISWQGWYREWIRGSWIAHPSRTAAFVPGDSAMLAAIRSWRRRQPELERAFYASRLPVR